jgi:hypothetical protein
VRETEHWIKELKKIKKRAAGDKLEAREQYYTEATLINLLATSRSAQQGKIAITLPGKWKRTLCKETWTELTESERQEIIAHPKAASLEVAFLVSKTQEEIKDLVQSNIEEAVRHVYALQQI